jgi:ketosteroid isomerase-like protein
MSEKDNIALIRKLYDAFAKGDVKTILDNLTPDVEWIMEGPKVIPYAGRFVGPGQVVKFFEGIGGTQDGCKLTTDDYIAQGDKVVTVGRYAATVKATGRKIDCAVAHVFTFRNGKIAKLVDFIDTAQTAEAYSSKAKAA